jgi:tryptophanyl-tRNA synthetase
MKLVSAEDVHTKFKADYNNCIIRYGDMKKQLAEDMIRFIAPIREKSIAIQNDKSYLEKVMREGAAKARESAAKTLALIRSNMGI